VPTEVATEHPGLVLQRVRPARAPRTRAVKPDKYQPETTRERTYISNGNRTVGEGQKEDHCFWRGGKGRKRSPGPGAVIKEVEMASGESRGGEEPGGIV